MTQIGIRISNEELEIIKEYARQKGLPYSRVMVNIVIDFIDKESSQNQLSDIADTLKKLMLLIKGMKSNGKT